VTISDSVAIVIAGWSPPPNARRRGPSGVPCQRLPLLRPIPWPAISGGWLCTRFGSPSVTHLKPEVLQWGLGNDELFQGAPLARRVARYILKGAEFLGW